ncbi:MAG: alpha/beta fold hydrolase [Anaerolineae bacterium]
MRWKRWALGLLLVVVLAAAGFVVWAEMPLGPMPEAVAALQSDPQVVVETEPWLIFRPAEVEPEIGLILYPGGRVDPRSYAPPAREIAAAGYLVVIPPMPLNLAFFAPGRAEAVMAAFPDIRRWVVGGHSLGGAMAANFAYTRPERVAGLVLWASWPAEGNSLADSDLPVLSVYGTEDMGLEGIEAGKTLLPPHTRWVVMEGGNHAQFGWYGPQPGDGEATISRRDQQAQVVAATIAFLNEIEP